MENKYSWAVNPAKLQRAIAKVAIRNGSEEDVKAEYILIGGLVREVEVEEGVEEVSIEEEGTDEAPKAKKAKKNA
jgi:hypothetical protein